MAIGGYELIFLLIGLACYFASLLCFKPYIQVRIDALRALSYCRRILGLPKLDDTYSKDKEENHLKKLRKKYRDYKGKYKTD